MRRRGRRHAHSGEDELSAAAKTRMHCRHDVRRHVASQKMARAAALTWRRAVGRNENRPELE